MLFDLSRAQVGALTVGNSADNGALPPIPALAAEPVSNAQLAVSLAGLVATLDGIKTTVEALAVEANVATATSVAVESSSQLMTFDGKPLLGSRDPSARIGYWFAQNFSTNDLLVVLDDGQNGQLSVYPLAAAPDEGGSGGSIGSADTGPHTGRIRVFGATGSMHSLRTR